MNEITLPQEEFERLLTEAKQGGTDAGRRAFIRQAAIALYAGPLDFEKDDAWHAAKVLWDVKPEDC